MPDLHTPLAHFTYYPLAIISNENLVQKVNKDNLRPPGHQGKKGSKM